MADEEFGYEKSDVTVKKSSIASLKEDIYLP
jgi:hypothetical protein